MAKKTEETMPVDENTVDGLKKDMIALARKICKEINDGSARDYYQSIEAVIKLNDSINK